MQSSQKQLNISISKILNWPSTKTNSPFQLIFLPLDSNIPLLEKSILGTYYSNAMNLNATLKITYTDDQNTLILKLLTPTKTTQYQLLGDFQLNLDSLKSKKIQYFSFSSGYVLQINLYTPNKSKTNNYHYLPSKNQPPTKSQPNFHINQHDKYPIKSQLSTKKNKYQHIKQNSYLTDYHQQKNTFYHNYQSKDKKSFSEKINLLLQQVKQIKQNMKISSINIDQPQNAKNNKNSNDKVIKKSMSEGKYSVYGVVLKPQKNAKDNPKNPTPNQKHRLILNNCNIVPCDEYYQNQKQLPIFQSKPQLSSNHQKAPKNKINHKNNNYYQDTY